ncbi:hypothetical protein ACJMK2_029373 [Sinanodonta woodiana]|uniref:Uncharacterized protein n=1 Tax=Sinanodonta woodiana TaxID=1069815 RepID=A0ABD3XBG1_SINWO
MEHMHEGLSLQYCILHLAQPNGRQPHFEHMTENDARHANVTPSTASIITDNNSNVQLQNSMESAPHTDSPNYTYSIRIRVFSDSVNHVQDWSSIYQDSIFYQSNNRTSDCHLGADNDTASVGTENTERPRHPMNEQCSSRVASYAT